MVRSVRKVVLFYHFLRDNDDLMVTICTLDPPFQLPLNGIVKINYIPNFLKDALHVYVLSELC